jgi:DNA-binding XRE family transcriptional regulator
MHGEVVQMESWKWTNNNLEKIRKSKGLQIGWIAEKAGCSRNTYTELKKGSDPHISFAYKIAKVMGVTVYDIWPSFPWPPEESK